MKKKIVSIVALYTTIAFVNAAFPNLTKADMKLEAGSYEQFLYEESEEYTGLVDKEIENELNMQGVLDRDIESFSSETIEKLNAGEDYVVSVQYFEEEDNEIQKMSQYDVEEFFDEVYEERKEEKFHRGESFELEKQEEEHSLMETLGLEEKVFAATESKTSSSGKLHTVLLAFQTLDDHRYMYTDATAEWIIEPNYTMNDYLCISVGGKDSVFDMNMPYFASYKYKLYCTGGSTQTQIFDRTDAKELHFLTNGIYTCVNLCDDSPTYTVKNHILCVGGFIYVNNNTTDGVINIYLKYAHQQKKLNDKVSVSVSVNTRGDISFGLSSGSDFGTYYNVISKVPSMSYNYRVHPTCK